MKPNYLMAGLVFCLALMLPAAAVVTPPGTLTLVVKKTPPTIVIPYNGANVTIDMNSVFGFKEFNGTLVRFFVQKMTSIGGARISNTTTGNTTAVSPTFVPMGNIDFQMHPEVAPKTVANFLQYVNNFYYGYSFIHRLDTSVGIFQGGAFGITQNGTTGALSLQDVPTLPSVNLEYNATMPNDVGTLAMARTSDPNSATSQWFLNMTNNTVELGPGNGGGYAVFAKVVGPGMTLAKQIYNGTAAANSTVLDLSSNNFFGGAGGQMPVINYVAGGEIAKITSAGNSTFIANATTFADAKGLGFDSNGTLFVSTSGDGVISEVSPSGNVSTFINGGQSLTGLALDGNNDLYVLDQVDGSVGNGTMYFVTPDGSASTLTAGFWSPQAVVYNKLTGNLFVTNYGNGSTGNGTISEVTPEGNVTTFASNLTAPAGLAIDGNGTLYVSSYITNGSIYKVSPAGVVTKFVSKLDTIRSLAIDSNGNLFAASNSGNNAIFKITPAGNVSVFHQDPTRTPISLVFDGSHNLYTGYMQNGLTFENLIYVTASQPLREFYSTVNYTGVISFSSNDSINSHIMISPIKNMAGKLSVKLYAFTMAGKTITTLVSVLVGSPNFTTEPPANSSVAVGGNLTLTTAAIGPSVAITKYAWYKDGKALHNMATKTVQLRDRLTNTVATSTTTGIAGATGPVLHLTNMHPADAGTYTLHATNLIGTTLSTPAKVTVGSQ